MMIKEGEYAPFSMTWRIERIISNGFYLLTKRTSEQFRTALLYVFTLHLLQPKKRSDKEKYNHLYHALKEIPTMQERLRYCRYQKNYRQIDVARQAGIDYGTYLDYETTERYCPLDKLERIAEILDVDMDCLLDDYHRFLYGGQGNELRKMRKILHLKREDIATATGVHIGTVKRWELETIRLSREHYNQLRSSFHYLP